MAIERQIARQDAERYERMMREEPGKYWSSPEIQAEYRAALERSIAAPPMAPTEQGGQGAPAVPGAPGTAEPAAAPVAAPAATSPA